MSRAKRWTFTVNNPAAHDHPPLWLPEHTTYGFQYEKGQQGTPHIQGWCTFSDKLSLAAAKRLHPTAHWEIMRGSLKKNIEYCSKEDSSESCYFTNGDASEKPPMQALREDIESGSALREIYSRNFSLSCR